MTDFAELKATWTALGAIDPLWAILTRADKEHGGWQLGEFFATGETDVDYLFARLEALGVRLRCNRALDFGCGVGRVSRALATRFAAVDGVDIAESMIAHASRLNADRPNCCFHVNHRDDLALFADGRFDLVYSRIVLQHMMPQYSTRYLRELMRVLAPGGAAVFQLPAAPRPIDDSLRAEIRVLEPVPARLQANQQCVLRCAVRNVSSRRWVSAAPHELNLGNHWYDESHVRVVNDDGRARLPDLDVGESCEVSLRVTAPPAGGAFLLGIDAVQEHVSWFADAGSREVRLAIDVIGEQSAHEAAPPPGLQPWVGAALAPLADDARAADAAIEKPQMEMYGVPREEVLALIASAGGRMLAVDHDGAAGPEWESYCYYVTK